MVTDIDIWFGVKFKQINEVSKNLMRRRTLVVVPAAPALATIEQDMDCDGQARTGSYLEAIREADFAIYDSFYLKLLLIMLRGRWVKKYSGVRFLAGFTALLSEASGARVLLLDPSSEASERNSKWLESRSPNTNVTSYVCPIYGPGLVQDSNLLEVITKTNPDYVLINLGGGTQERVGLYIKRSGAGADLQGIICTGAAIAFETGEQVKIYPWVDRVGLGWLARIMDKPATYGRRYLSAVGLVRVFWKHA